MFRASTAKYLLLVAVFCLSGCAVSREEIVAKTSGKSIAVISNIEPVLDVSTIGFTGSPVFKKFPAADWNLGESATSTAVSELQKTGRYSRVLSLTPEELKSSGEHPDFLLFFTPTGESGSTSLVPGKYPVLVTTPSYALRIGVQRLGLSGFLPPRTWANIILRADIVGSDGKPLERPILEKTFWDPEFELGDGAIIPEAEVPKLKRQMLEKMRTVIVNALQKLELL